MSWGVTYFWQSATTLPLITTHKRRSIELRRYKHTQTSKICGAKLHASSLVTWAAVTWNIKQSNLQCRYGIPLGVGRGTDSTVATMLSWIQMWIASEHLNHILRKESRRWIQNGEKCVLRSSIAIQLALLSHQKVTLCSGCSKSVLPRSPGIATRSCALAKPYGKAPPIWANPV